MGEEENLTLECLTVAIFEAKILPNISTGKKKMQQFENDGKLQNFYLEFNPYAR